MKSDVCKTVPADKNKLQTITVVRQDGGRAIVANLRKKSKIMFKSERFSV